MDRAKLDRVAKSCLVSLTSPASLGLVDRLGEGEINLVRLRALLPRPSHVMDKDGFNTGSTTRHFPALGPDSLSEDLPNTGFLRAIEWQIPD